MNIVSSDAACSVSLGGYDTWQALCSTIRYHLRPEAQQLPNVFDFLETGHCSSENCLAAAREFNLARDYLSKLKPNQVVYDDRAPGKQAPWGEKISPVITSCANYFTTGNGDDLLAEIVKMLTYAAYAKANVDLK